tara:strand:+ start:3065 stop:3217 length:153 start_codon:yes stop_codon:yes gene_type:complete
MEGNFQEFDLGASSSSKALFWSTSFGESSDFETTGLCFGLPVFLDEISFV